jgi:hypothetical protein
LLAAGWLKDLLLLAEVGEERRMREEAIVFGQPRQLWRKEPQKSTQLGEQARDS